MLDQWLEAIEDLIITAPGNDGADGEPVWESTLSRLGEDIEADAKANRVFWEYFEPGEEEIEDKIPLFIITEDEWSWTADNANNFQAAGAVGVTYAERITDPDGTGPVIGNAAYKRAKTAYVKWLGNLVQNCAARAAESGIYFTRILQTAPVSRTRKERRDADRPESDYLWTMYSFHVGLRA